MNHLPRIAQRLFNTPLALRAEKAEVVLSVLADRLGVAGLLREGKAFALEADDPRFTDRAREPAERGVGYDLVAGVAVIAVEGTLVQKAGALRPQSGMTGYDGLRLNLHAALADPAARAVAFLFDSPGGEVAGVADLADAIAAARDAKPVWGILDEEACSAAYWLASACSIVTMPRTGVVGSIGTVILQTEMSRALDRQGVAVNIIRSSPRKGEGGSLEPLSDPARARLQAAVDAMNDRFVAAVARNRGLSPDAVRATDAGWFVGEEGVAAGLADAVMPVDEAFQALLSSLPSN